MSQAKAAETRFQTLARKKWESSGLDASHASRLRLEALDGTQVAALAENFTATPALKIPYFDLTGEPTQFYRIRYLAKPAGFAGLIQKPQRYAQPTGIAQRGVPAAPAGEVLEGDRQGCHGPDRHHGRGVQGGQRLRSGDTLHRTRRGGRMAGQQTGY